MSDPAHPFAPPDTDAPAREFERLEHPTQDAQLVLLAVVHALFAVLMLGAGAVYGVMAVAMIAMPQPGTEGTAAFLLMAAGLLALWGLVYAAAAGCVLRPNRATHIIAAVATGLWILSCCAPIGAWGLWVLLRPRTLDLYGYTEPGPSNQDQDGALSSLAARPSR